MGKCLVTGGAGFIGAHVARALLDAGREVVVLDDLSGGFRENVDPRARLVTGSICDHQLVDRLFEEERFHRVYHLGAYAAEGLSHFIKRYNYNNNVIGSVNLINAAILAEVDCFVFTSSIAVYGAAQLPMTEDIVPVPEDSYGIAKRTVELELVASKAMFGMDFVIFRPHNVYGELQNIGDRYRNVVGIFMNQIMRNEPLSVFGDGTQSRAFSYIGDLAPVIATAPDVPGARNEIFNIGAEEPTTVIDLARAVCRAMGASGHPIRHLQERHEVKHAYAGHEKLHRIFGSRRQTPLEAGLGRMAAWARKIGARETPPFAAIEIPRGLPPFWLQPDRPAGGPPASARS